MGFACGRYASSSTHSSADVASLHPGEGKPQQIDLHLRFARLCIAGIALRRGTQGVQRTKARWRHSRSPARHELHLSQLASRSARVNDVQQAPMKTSPGLLSDCTRDLIQSYCLDGIDALCVSAASCT